MSKRFFRWVIIGCLLWGALAPVSAAGSAGSLPPEISQQLVNTDPGNFPNANLIQLWDEETIRYERDGCGTDSESSWIYICNEKGRKDMRVQRWHFNRFYAELTVEEITVYRRTPDGAWQPIAVELEHALTEGASNSSLKSNIVDPDKRVVTATLPELRIGDIVHTRYTRRTIRPRISGVWCGIFTFQDDDPIRFSRVTIDAPAELPLRNWRIRDEVPGTMKILPPEKRDGRIVYRFEAANVPMMIPEPNMPPVYLCCQRLCASSAADWREISRWYWQLCQPHLERVTPEMTALVAKLTEKTSGDEEKVREIFRFVSQNIRYMGLTAEQVSPGYEPHDVDMTFDKRYGVCRDKAALLVALLRSAGLSAYPVLFMSGAIKDAEVPDIYFNHAVAAWEKSPGQYVLMDPTAESTRDFMPAYNSESSYLVARSEGEILQCSAVTAAEANRADFQIDAQLEFTGALRGECRLSLEGYYDNIFRHSLLRMSEAERRKLFARMLSQAIPRAQLRELVVTPKDLQNTGEKMVLKLRFELDNFLPDSGGEWALALPEFAENFSLITALAGNLDLERRHYPLRNHATFSVVEKLNIQLPDGGEIAALPPKLDIRNRQWEYRRQFEVEKSTLRRERELAVRQITIPADGYADFKAFIGRFRTDGSAMPVFRLKLPEKPRSAAVGAGEITRLDEVEFEFIPNGVVSRQQLRRRILNYSGVKRNSEFIYGFYPDFQTVKVTGAVTPPSGKKQELSERECNIVDDSRSLTAPRYPRRQLLVVNLPGVQPGSEIELQVERHYNDLAIPSITAGLTDPGVGNFRYLVRLPKTGFFHNTEIPDGVDFRRRSVEAGEELFLQRESLVARKKEENLVPSYLEKRNFTVSASSYAEFAAAIQREVAALVVTRGEKIRTVVANLELNSESLDRPEKITRIRDFVDRNIRLAGPSFNELPFRYLSEPEVTLQSGYGNGADRAILIAALLKSAGIDAQLIPVSSFGYTPEAVRMLKRTPLNIFNHVLVHISDGDIYLNNAGTFQAPLGATTHQDKIAFDPANGKIFAIRPQHGFENRIDRRIRLKLAADGSAVARVKFIYWGGKYAAFQVQARQLVPETARRFVEKLGNQIFPGAQLVKHEIDFDHYPGKISAEFSLPIGATRSGDYLVCALPMPDLQTALSGVTAQRHRDLYFHDSFVCQNEYEVIPPAGFVPLHPRKERGTELIGRFNLYSDIRIDSDRINLRYRVSHTPELLTVDQVKALQNLRNRRLNRESFRLLLAPENEEGRP